MIGAVQQIGQPCQSPFNAGFLTHLYLIRTDEVVFAHIPTGSSLLESQQPIGIQSGAIITQFLIRPKTAVFSEASSETGDGVAFQTILTLPIKGTAVELTLWVHQNVKARFVILARDTLGFCYMIGSADNGARLAWQRDVSSQSSHRLELRVTGWHPAQFLPTIDLDEIFPDREFDYSFDLSFS